MNKFTEQQLITIARRIIEGRLNYYDETITPTKNFKVLMDACAALEQLRIELRETKDSMQKLLDEAYELIRKNAHT